MNTNDQMKIPTTNIIKYRIAFNQKTDEWKEYLEEVRKHPNMTDIENAKKFACHILTLYSETNE